MNQSTMTDKNKSLEKILKKQVIKGLLKPVDSLENCELVLVENKRCVYRGESYQPDIVHFLVNGNKRNVLNVNNSILTPRIMGISRV